MSVTIQDVSTRSQLRTFIHLPARIHRDHPGWVPPLYSEDWKFFNPKRNKAFALSDTVLALGYRGTEPAGRIMGIINHRANSYAEERNGRFCFLECNDDREVAHALLSYIETWARDRGMRKCIGPMGFTDQDPEGFLIEGFEHESSLSTYWNSEHIPRLLEEEDYTKEVDYVVYRVDLPDEIPEFYTRILKRIERNRDYTPIEFTKKKELKPYIRPIFQLMNDTFKDNYGYVPLEEEEMDELGKKYLPVVDPRFVKIVVKNQDTVAFIIGIPNMAPGIRAAKGRLFPFGFLKILAAARRTKQLDLYLGGIKEECRGKGLDVILGFKMISSAIEAGFEFLDSHHELESNLRMRAEMERMGGKIYKRFRIYQKSLF